MVMNSPIGGISSFSISFFIIPVANDDMPGSAPRRVGMCIPGFPTVATFRLFIRFLMIASRPKKVKKTEASIPSMRAPLAIIRPGYTPSSDPCEMMMETLCIGSGVYVCLMVTLSLNAALWFWKSCNLCRALCGALREELIQRLGIHAALLGQTPNRGRIAFFLKDRAHEVNDGPVLWRELSNALLDSELTGQIFIPIVAIGEIPVSIQFNRLSNHAYCSHMS